VSIGKRFFSHLVILTFWITWFSLHWLITGGLRARQLMCPSQIVTLMLFPYVMGFENAVDKRKALQEMFRVLRPGPIFFPLIWINKSWHFSPLCWYTSSKASVLDFNCKMKSAFLSYFFLSMFVDIMCLDSEEWNPILSNECFCINNCPFIYDDW
jgi:SAM-dependent methyltransferase